MLEHLFTPMKIGTCEIPNRFVVPAMEANVNNADGTITERYIRYMEEKAKGGFGLLITEDYSVTEFGRAALTVAGFFDDRHVEKNKEFTERIHKYGSKIFCQLYHSGKQTWFSDPRPVAPAAIKDPLCQVLPRELTIEEIHGIVKAFGDAAERVKASGFDGIEIHGAHGYLIAQFLSPFINKRTDEYGGCFENRVRFLDEIYQSIRERVGRDFPVIIRISVNEWVEGGRTEAESYLLARHCEEMGYAAIHVSNGAYASPVKHQVIAPMSVDHAVNMEYGAQIKQLVDIPVILANRINDAKMADTLIKMGKADFIAVGRGSIADPFLPDKAKRGDFEAIHYCIGCLQGCTNMSGMTCLVNPRVTREGEELSPAENQKKVMIVGAGPAGLMAAKTAAKRVHKVTVFEKDSHYGGAFRSAAYPMGKGELTTVISSYRKSCLDLGVEIKLNTEVTEELIKKEKPDAVILATGSRPIQPPIDGIHRENVVTAEDVLYGNRDVAPGPVVVCGGGEVGGETAEFIAQTNQNVTLLEMKGQILNDMVFQTRVPLLERLAQKKVKIITDAKVVKITEENVVYANTDGSLIPLPASTVVSAFGYKEYNPLEEAAKSLCGEVYVIGSARKAGNALVATREGYEAAMKL